MEEVLNNSLKTRKRPGANTGNTSAPAAATEPASWTGRVGSREAETFSKPTLPYPLSALFSLVDSHKDYPSGCQNMAVFLKKLSGNHSLEDLMLQVVQARFPRVWMERFLFILLEVQASDWQTAGYALQFRHLKRLLLRVERKTPLNAVESGLARELISALPCRASRTSNPSAAAPPRPSSPCRPAISRSPATWACSSTFSVASARQWESARTGWRAIWVQAIRKPSAASPPI